MLHINEQSSLWYRVGPCWLSILNIAVYVHVKINVCVLPLKGSKDPKLGQSLQTMWVFFSFGGGRRLLGWEVPSSAPTRPPCRCDDAQPSVNSTESSWISSWIMHTRASLRWYIPSSTKSVHGFPEDLWAIKTGESGTGPLQAGEQSWCVLWDRGRSKCNRLSSPDSDRISLNSFHIMMVKIQGELVHWPGNGLILVTWNVCYLWVTTFLLKTDLSFWFLTGFLYG